MSLTVSSPISLSENEYEILRLQKDVGSEIIKNIRTVLRDEDINFTEDLSNSFALVMMNGKTSVETENRYASLVDRGMSAGNWVNYDALHDWVRIKLNIDDPEAESVTWKILRKINKEGIQPTRFVKKSLKMTIGEHGIRTIRRKTGGGKKKQSLSKRIGKVLNKINRTIRKIRRPLNRFSNNINKVIKPIRRFK